MTVSDQLYRRALSADAKRLARIRERAGVIPAVNAAYSDGAWLLEWDDPVHGRVEMARFAQDVPQEIIDLRGAAGDDIRFLVTLVERARARIRSLESGRKPAQGMGLDFRGGGRTVREGKDYAAECAMKCTDPQFRAFLVSMHGLEHGSDQEFLVGKVRQILEVASRKDLNTNAVAALRWRELVHAFETWQRAQ